MSQIRTAALLLSSVLCTLTAHTQGAPLAQTPPMGWNSWNHFAERVSDADVRATADMLVSSGMRDAGYVYVNIDDTWQGKRDAAGVLHSNEKFPDMKALADYVHSKGLKIGIYSSPGPQTCANYEGSYGHEQQDAELYASWGMDYLKYDLCSFGKLMNDRYPDGMKQDELNGRNRMMRGAYEKMRTALQHTGRPIVYSFCQYGYDSVWAWAPATGGNLWRTTDDIRDSWDSMTSIGFAQAGLEKYAGPGHWNDPDMLEVGNGKMRPDEYRTHFSLWAMLAAPLLAGNDLSQMDDTTRSILLNREVIAVDQDSLGTQAHRVSADGPVEVWSRPLAGGGTAVALFNRGEEATPLTLDLERLNLPSGARVRDVWAHQPVTMQAAKYTQVVPRHGVAMYVVRP